MNLVLLFAADTVPPTSKVLLTGRRHAHVLEIHRAHVGDTLIVGMENGKIGQGLVTRLTDKELEMDVSCIEAPPPKIPVVLAVALMRPIVFRRVLQMAAAMGVEAVHVFHSRRVEKSFWNSASLDPRDVHQQLVLGLEQARDTVIPEVIFHKRFNPFAQDVLPQLLKAREGVVADPSGSLLTRVSKSSKVLIIGPEGGFIPYELETFREAGCALAGLGPRILRVETAITAFLSRLS